MFGPDVAGSGASRQNPFPLCVQSAPAERGAGKGTSYSKAELSAERLFLLCSICQSDWQ